MATVLQHHPRGAPFGEFLRDARERRGLTLRDVSNETKIPWRHLEAFEHGDLTVVSNGMYRRAEVRAYARAVGLDQNVALEELEHALLISGMDAPKAEPAPPASTESRHPLAATLVVVGIAWALLVIWQGWTKSAAPPRAPTVTAPAAAAPAVVVPAAATPEVVAPAVVGPAVVGPNFSSANQPSVDVGPSFSSAEIVTATPTATTTNVAPGSADNALEVTTDPPGARVMVDGIGRGTTPVTIRFLTPGDKTVRVIKDGYASEERSVRVTDGHPASVHVALRTAAN